MLGLGVYGLSRFFLLATAAGISAVDHLSLSLVLRSWDGKYYLWDAHHGYPSALDLHTGKPDAFFPVYPLAVRLVHFVTQLSWTTSGVLVAMLAGAFLVAAGALLAEAVFGPEAAAKSALVLALFPGSFVAGLTYADALGLALAALFLLLMYRGRWLAAGAVGMVATATFSLLLVPLIAVCLWVALAERRRRALLTGAMTGLGTLGFLIYIWAHTHDPFFWFRLQHVKWHSGPGLSLKHGTLWALQSNWEVGPLTALCIIAGILGLVALRHSKAPPTWLVFSSVVFAISLFDTGTHPTPRLLLAMFPAWLAAGTKLSERLTVPVLTMSLLGLCLCLAIYAPENWVFFSP